MAGNWRKYKKIPPGSCNGNPACPNKTGGHHYCPRHRAMYRRAQNARRAMRRQMGLCIFCLDPADPGYTRCTRHRVDAAAAHQRMRDSKAAKRGWKLVRVPIAPEVTDGQRRGPRR
jgi:hypothetical protein